MGVSMRAPSDAVTDASDETNDSGLAAQNTETEKQQHGLLYSQPVLCEVAALDLAAHAFMDARPLGTCVHACLWAHIFSMLFFQHLCSYLCEEKAPRLPCGPCRLSDRENISLVM